MELHPPVLVLDGTGWTDSPPPPGFPLPNSTVASGTAQGYLEVVSSVSVMLRAQCQQLRISVENSDLSQRQDK